jgi:hypothetical protein
MTKILTTIALVALVIVITWRVFAPAPVPVPASPCQHPGIGLCTFAQCQTVCWDNLRQSGTPRPDWPQLPAGK